MKTISTIEYMHTKRSNKVIQLNDSPTNDNADWFVFVSITTMIFVGLVGAALVIAS